MRATVLLVSALCLLASSNSVFSQKVEYPSRGVTTIIVPQAAGGATDILARVIAKHLSTGLNQRVIVENYGGANGNIGGLRVATSAPDGHTLLLAPATGLIQFTPMPLGYDPLVDLIPVALVAEAPEFITISATLPARTLSEFINLARSKPGALNYGSPGVGTVPHLSTERLMQATDIKMTHVPYRGVAPAMVDLASGTIQMAVGSLSSVQAFSEAATVRVLAITAKERLPAMPDVPTLEELGYKGLEMSTWWGIMAPKGTPPQITQLLNTKLREAVAEPETVDTLRKLGIVARSETIETFANFIQTEAVVWGKIAKHVGIAER